MQYPRAINRGERMYLMGTVNVVVRETQQDKYS